MGEHAPVGRAPLAWRAARAALQRMWRGAMDFSRRVYLKAGDDDIFFLAGGIAFNVVLGALPFLLLLIAVFGIVLERAVDDPEQAAVNYVLTILPPSQQIVGLTRGLVREVVGGRTQFGILGLVLFIWTSTRLFGTLRSVLRHVFDLPEERGIVAGKIFDLQMVVVAGTLFLLNTGITVVVEAAQAYGVEWLGLAGRAEWEVTRRVFARLLAFASILLAFVLMYRYLPLRKTPWRVSLVAGVFMAVTWEVLKGAFAWYVSNADYRTTYGTLATLVLLVLWVYYSACVFVLGGEVAQVWDLIRRRRKQRELLE